MPVTVEMRQVDGKPRIALTGWGGPDTPNRCKRINGSSAKWDKSGSKDKFEFWHFPLDLTTCRVLRSEFPDLIIGPRLTAWARVEIERREGIMDFHVRDATKPVDLPEVRTHAPTIWSAYQNRGFQTIVPAFAKEVGPHFNADQPGCGKTIEELGALVECGIRGTVLIIAPRKALRTTWAREINRWLAPDFKVDVHVVDSEEGTMAEREEYLSTLLGFHASQEAVKDFDFRFVLINPEAIRWEFVCGHCRNGNSRSCENRTNHTKSPLYPSLFVFTWDAVLADETHKFMMNGNERSSSVSQVGYGFQKLKAKTVAGLEYKVGMSGTPFKGKPRKFWPVLHWLRKDKYNGAGKWYEQFFEMEMNNTGFGYAGKKPTDNIRRDRESLFYEDLGLIMVRRTKRELHKMNPAWAPPDKLYDDVRIPMDGKQRKAYKQMESQAAAQIEKGTLIANGVLAEMTRLKQFAIGYGRMVGGEFKPALPSCKWDWIKNVFLAERGILDDDGESKVVIASQFVSVLEMYAADLDKMKIPYFLIEGPTKDIEKIQDQWQSPYQKGDPRIILLSTMAGGVSLTLDAADDLVLNDETWTPDDQEQVEDRVHRTSRTDHQVTIYRLITLGTIDEMIADSGDALDVIQKKVLDGRRGVAYAKRFVNAAEA